MLIIECPEYYQKVRSEVSQAGLLPKLQAGLNQLCELFANTADPESVRHRLFKDFAKWSFVWSIERREKDGTWKQLYNGGLIYSGPTQKLDGSAPAFCVSLGDPEEGWSIHT